VAKALCRETGASHSWGAYLDGIISGGVVSAVPTVAGRRYKLTMRIGTYEVKDEPTSGPVAVYVAIGGKFAGRLDHPGGDAGSLTQWVTRSMVFIALGPTTEVAIHGWTPPDVTQERLKKSKVIATPTLIGLDFVSVRE